MGDGLPEATRLTALPALPRAPRPAAAGLSPDAAAAAARQSAAEFEAVFIGQMVKPMFATLNAEPPFGGGFAEEIWRDILADEIGRTIAAAGGIGLADSVARELLRAQENAAAGPTTGPATGPATGPTIGR